MILTDALKSYLVVFKSYKFWPSKTLESAEWILHTTLESSPTLILLGQLKASTSLSRESEGGLHSSGTARARAGHLPLVRALYFIQRDFTRMGCRRRLSKRGVTALTAAAYTLFRPTRMFRCGRAVDLCRVSDLNDYYSLRCRCNAPALSREVARLAVCPGFCFFGALRSPGPSRRRLSPGTWPAPTAFLAFYCIFLSTSESELSAPNQGFVPTKGE